MDVRQGRRRGGWIGAAARFAPVIGLAGLCGCGGGYHWRTNYAEFHEAEQQANDQGRFLLIFYKMAFDSTSNRMFEVLSDPQVEAQFKDTINVLVDKVNGPQYVAYMRKYRVSEPPAVVIVSPKGLYEVRTGFVPKEPFLDFVYRVMPPEPKGAAKGAATARLP